MLRCTVLLALALGAAADGGGRFDDISSDDSPSKPPTSAPKPSAPMPSFSAAPLFELGRGVTFYKNLDERWNMGERVADGVALTADFTSGSEGDVGLKWTGIEKWKGSDIDLDASLTVPVKVDASLVKPVSYKLKKMAASASAKRGAIKLSLATDATTLRPKSLALEWVTTKTMLPKELTGGAKFTLTPTLRPREWASKGLAAAADCKAKIELLPHYENYKGKFTLNGPKAVAELTMSPRVRLSTAKISTGARARDESGERDASGEHDAVVALTVSPRVKLTNAKISLVISDVDKLAISKGAIQLTRSLPEDGAEVSLGLKASKAGEAPVLDVAWLSPRDPYGGWKLKASESEEMCHLIPNDQIKRH